MNSISSSSCSGSSSSIGGSSSSSSSGGSSSSSVPSDTTTTATTTTTQEREDTEENDDDDDDGNRDRKAREEAYALSRRMEGEEAIVLARKAVEIFTQLDGSKSSVDPGSGPTVGDCLTAAMVGLAEILDYFSDADVEDEVIRLNVQAVVRLNAGNAPPSTSYSINNTSSSNSSKNISKLSSNLGGTAQHNLGVAYHIRALKYGAAAGGDVDVADSGEEGGGGEGGVGSGGGLSDVDPRCVNNLEQVSQPSSHVLDLT